MLNKFKRLFAEASKFLLARNAAAGFAVGLVGALLKGLSLHTAVQAGVGGAALAFVNFIQKPEATPVAMDPVEKPETSGE